MAKGVGENSIEKLTGGANKCNKCGYEKIVCPHCGALLDSGNHKFCPECGKPLVRKCPKCGTIIKGKEKFCPECGEKL